MFTDRKRRLASIMWALLVSKALQSGFPVIEAVVDVEEDPEEDTRQIVLRVYADATAVQTFAFWDSLTVDMDRWLPRMKASDRDVVLNDIGFRFHWVPR